MKKKIGTLFWRFILVFFSLLYFSRLLYLQYYSIVLIVLHHCTGCSSRHKRQSLTCSDTAMLIYTRSSISTPIQPGAPSTKSHTSFVSETGLTWLQSPEPLRCQADQCIMHMYMHAYFHIVEKKE